MTTRTVGPRAALMVDRLESGGWKFLVNVDLENGGLVRTYRSKVDRRVTACLSKLRRSAPTVRSFRFADDGIIEVEVVRPPLIGDEGELFASIEQLAVAIVAHDDERAWLRATPAADTGAAA
jgi:hypothetical protein